MVLEKVRKHLLIGVLSALFDYITTLDKKEKWSHNKIGYVKVITVK